MPKRTFRRSGGTSFRKADCRQASSALSPLVARAQAVERVWRTAVLMGGPKTIRFAINAIQAAGVTTLQSIAAELNRRGIPTAAGRGQ
jgi:hypothetical protein